MVTLMYRGYLDRTDGTRVAMIENQSTAEISFYAVESQVAGFQLGAFDRGTATLRAGIRQVKLEVGEAVELEAP